jgi:methyl-accepting chemotaxis protein
VKLSLSVKISITVISLISVGGAVITYLIYARSAESLKTSISSIQLQLTRQSMDKIDRFLYERTVDIQELINRESIQRYLGHPTGRTTEASNQLVKQLNRYRVLGGSWENLSLIDTKGKAVLSTDALPAVSALQRQTEFQTAYDKAVAGEVNYSDLFTDRADDTPIMLFVAPVRDITEQAQPIVGVVVGELAWQSALETIRNIQDAHAVLLNKHGVHLGENTSEQNDEILKKSRTDSIVFQQARNDQVTQILPAVEDESPHLSAQNEGFVTSYVKEGGYLDYKGNGWLLILQTPVSTALAPVTSLRGTVISIFTLTAIITAALALLLARRFTGPIGALTQRALAISNGNLQQRVPVSSHDEVGTLAQAFNVMTDRLASSYAALEQKVAERTKQLQI